MRILWITSIILLFTGCKREITQEKSTLVKLSNKDINLTINMYGGNIIGFSFNKDSLNPFTWKLTSEQMPDNNKKGAPFEGHFLCLGRWGSPTEGEKAMGVPYNGEASNSLWNYKNTQKSVEFSVDAPKDGMSVKRSIELDSLSPVFYATDIIKSTISIGRLNNIVQHITVGPPFMDSNLIINTNASKGFLQTMSYPDPTKYEFTWPEGYKDSTKTPLDLTLSNENFSYVSTHIYEDSLGWIVAYNPKKQLLLGYIWRTAEYPWLNLWNEYVDGKPWAKGLEFGTTGIGKHYQKLISVNTIYHNRTSYEYLDAGQTVSKKYIGFILQIDQNFPGIDSISYEKNSIRIQLKNNKNLEIKTDRRFF